MFQVPFWQLEPQRGEIAEPRLKAWVNGPPNQPRALKGRDNPFSIPPELLLKAGHAVVGFLVCQVERLRHGETLISPFQGLRQDRRII
jgi:hypothetical protein